MMKIRRMVSRSATCTGVLAGLCIAQSACTRRESPPDLLADTVRVGVRNVGTMDLRLVDSIRFGVTHAERPSEMTDAVRDESTWYVLDYHDRTIHAYDLAGRALPLSWETLGRGKLSSPQRLALVGDTLMVADAGAAGVVLTFLRTGKFLSSRKVRGGGVETDLAMLGGQVHVAILAAEGNEGLGLVREMDEAPEERETRCVMDRRYVESRRAHGMLAMSTFTTLGRGDDGQLACVQPISLVVQLIAAPGHPRRTYAVVPPFYRGPIDRPKSLNAKQLAAYRAEWTAHRRAFGFRGGFLSFYEIPQAVGRYRYALFACSGAAKAPHCSSMETDERPLGFVPPDTLMMEPRREHATVVRYVIAQ